MCASSYPGALDSFTNKTDNVDDVQAAHVNNLQDAVVAIETELGTDPAGSFADVVTRLDNHPLNKLDGTTAPTVNEDSGDGYGVGSIWVDVTNDKAYICLDASSGAAVWEQIDRVEVPIPASAFYTISGSPARGTLVDAGTSVYGVATWRLDDASTESIGTAVQYRGGGSGSTVVVRIWYAMESANSGAIRLVANVLACADGESMTGNGTTASSDVSVPGTAKLVDYVDISLSEAYVAADLIRLSVARLGANPNDTASGDAHIIAVQVTFS
jgi:hypothetical protein